MERRRKRNDDLAILMGDPCYEWEKRLNEVLVED